MAIKTNDPLLSQQNWLFQQIGLDKIFDEYRGEGVKVGIYDDGLQASHSDLKDNYDASLEVKIGGASVSPGVGVHGTAVAGIIAAVGENGIGGVGIASEATIAGVNMFSGATSGSGMTEAIKQMTNFDVTNSSWNWTSKYADPVHTGFGKTFQAAIDYAVDNGRGGLGTAVINSAGNDWQTDRRDANTSGFDSTRETITVGAVGDNGIVASYANRGANILVSAPSTGGSKGVTTTDIEGSGGYTSGDSYNYFGGTSAAAPVVAGVTALMIEANGSLGWRDIKEILAMSADHTGSAIGGAKVGTEAFGWSVNGASEFNGGGMHFSNDYGFGKVDAYTAVRMAEVWSLFQNAQTSANERTGSFSGTVNKNLVDNGDTTFTINVTKEMRLEHVDLQLTLTHPNVNQLQVELVSPDGTKSIMLTPGTGAAINGSNWTWTFGSEQFLGELSAGTWTVRITDTVTGGTGKVTSYKMDIYGSDADANNVYHYTDEFAKMLALDASRGTLVDSNGGIDWVNAAGIDGDITLDLTQGATSRIDGANFITIGSGTVIENAVTGDGDDTISGNDSANALYGMRGNDTFDGGAGADLLDGGAGNDTASYGRSNAGVNVDLLRATQTGGHAEGDRLVSIENVTGSAFNDVLRGDADANVLRGAAGDDILEGRGGGDVLDGGAGFDIASYETSAAAISVDTTGGSAVVQGGDAAGDTFISIEGYRGTGFNDTFFGGASNDHFEGGAGDDVLDGGAGADYLDGGAGKDAVTYARSNAAVSVDLLLATQSGGHAQGDRLTSVENIIGSAFADTLRGDAADNILRGGAGNDVLEGRGGADVLDGGEGFDIASYENSDAPVVVNASTMKATGGDGAGDTFFSIEGFRGSRSDDVFVGSTGNDYFEGLAGNDTFMGSVGSDRLDGGAGNDTVDYSASNAAVKINLGTGVVSGGHAEGDTLHSIENATGSAFDDVLVGDAGDNGLRGGAGNDTLIGGLGADTLDGGTGWDTVDYSASNAGVMVNMTEGFGWGGHAEGDTLLNIDHLTGSKFGDSIIGTDGHNLIQSGDGDDYVDGRGGGDVVYAGNGDDVIIGGNYGNNVYDGGAGGDTVTYAGSYAGITASLQSRTITSNAGGFVDILSSVENIVGSRFDDRIEGDAGVNCIDGAAGNDILTGGAGNDVFNFSATGFGDDRITDFTRGSDLISLIGLGLTFADLSFSDSANECIVNAADAGTITLAGINSSQLSESDFVFW